MIDLLAELNETNAWAAIYTGIFLGIALRMLLAWGAEYSVPSMDRPTRPTLLHLSLLYKRKSMQNSNFILVWISKFIRKKYCFSEDPEGSISSISFLI